MALSAKEQSKNINCLILVSWSTFETLHGCNDSPSWELRVASWGCQSYSKILIERIFLIWISENMHQVSTIKQLSEQLEQGRISLDALPMNEFQVAFHWPDLLEAFRNKTVERLETRSCGGEGKHCCHHLSSIFWGLKLNGKKWKPRICWKGCLFEIFETEKQALQVHKLLFFSGICLFFLFLPGTWSSVGNAFQHRKHGRNSKNGQTFQMLSGLDGEDFENPYPESLKLYVTCHKQESKKITAFKKRSEGGVVVVLSKITKIFIYNL